MTSSQGQSKASRADEQSPTGTLTFLFTDLVGSTELLTSLGDDRAVEIHRQVDGLLRMSINQGREIKNLGDGLMVTFASAVDAVQAAKEMQRRILDSGLDVAVKIGINSGEASSAQDDYFGTPVVLAQRLCELAAGGQILVSSVVRSLVGSKGSIAFAPRGRELIKGFTQPLEVYEVKWRDAEVAPSARESVAIGYPATLVQPAGGILVGRDDTLHWYSSPASQASGRRRRRPLGLEAHTTRERSSSWEGVLRKPSLPTSPLWSCCTNYWATERSRPRWHS
jgi:class 3 adenylate cyclase